jgi:hypothetical protein
LDFHALPALLHLQHNSICQELPLSGPHLRGKCDVSARAHFRYVETGEDVKPIPPTRPIPHFNPRCFVPPPPRPQSIKTFPVHLIDDQTTIKIQVKPISPIEIIDGIRLVLLAYGRAIINLTIDHHPDEAQALAEAISSAKLAVTAYHEDIVKDLQMDLRVKNEQIRQLQDSNEEQEERAMATEAELRREVLRERIERERLQRAWDEDAGRREEYKEMKEEAGRKRQRMMETWGKGEGLAEQLVLTGHQFL